MMLCTEEKRQDFNQTFKMINYNVIKYLDQSNKSTVGVQKVKLKN